MHGCSYLVQLGAATCVTGPGEAARLAGAAGYRLVVNTAGLACEAECCKLAGPGGRVVRN